MRKAQPLSREIPFCETLRNDIGTIKKGGLFFGEGFVQNGVAQNARVGFWQNDFSRSFNYWAAGSSRRIFSPHFCGKSAQKNPPGKSPANPPKFIQLKSPTHFCRGAGPRSARLGHCALRKLRPSKILDVFEVFLGGPTDTYYIASRYFSELITFDVMYLFTSIMVCELILGDVIFGRCMLGYLPSDWNTTITLHQLFGNTF